MTTRKPRAFAARIACMTPASAGVREGSGAITGDIRLGMYQVGTTATLSDRVARRASSDASAAGLPYSLGAQDVSEAPFCQLGGTAAPAPPAWASATSSVMAARRGGRVRPSIRGVVGEGVRNERVLGPYTGPLPSSLRGRTYI